MKKIFFSKASLWDKTPRVSLNSLKKKEQYLCQSIENKISIFDKIICPNYGVKNNLLFFIYCPIL